MTLPPLSEKQLWTIIRALIFGFTTVAAEMRFCGCSFEATTGFLGARVQTGWLKRFKIRHDLHGFQPTRAACTALEADIGLVNRFGSLQAILPRLAALEDCSARRVMPCAALVADLSTIRSTDYRLVQGESRPFALLMVDAGGNPVRFRFKLNAQFRSMKSDAGLGPLYRDGKIAIRVLSPSIGKAEALMKILAHSKPLGPVEFEIITEIEKCLLRV